MTSDLCHINLNHLVARCLSFFQVTVHETSVLNYPQQRIFYRGIACDDELYLVKNGFLFISVRFRFESEIFPLKLLASDNIFIQLKTRGQYACTFLTLKIG